MAEHGKMVINANLNRANVVKSDEFATIAGDTLQDIIEMILPLCGPKAMNDLIILENLAKEFMSNVFSNDGINILKSVEYMSPIQTYIANYIRYIAERVDSASSDGTSTAIYLSSTLIRNSLLHMQSKRDKLKSVVTFGSAPDIQAKTFLNMKDTHEFTSVVESLIEHILNNLNDIKIDLRELNHKVRNKLIYKLAYTTSKGNRKLAQYAVDLFSDLPEILYEQTYFRRSEIETDEEFMMDYPDYQAFLTVIPSGTTKYNIKLGTELLYETCDVLICPEYMNDATLLLDFIKQRKESGEDKALIIITNGLHETAMVAIERIIDTSRMMICQRVTYHPALAHNPTELFAVMAMYRDDAVFNYPYKSRESIDDYETSLIRNVHCHLSGKDLKISNLYDALEDSSLHPKYVSDGHTSYHKLRVEIEDRIGQLTSAHNRKSHTAEIAEFTKIFRMMVCGKLPILTLGGSTINHLANIDVVKDVTGVVSVAMKHGVIIDLMPKLHCIIKNFKVSNLKSEGAGNFIDDFAKAVASFATMTYARVSINNTEKVLIHSLNEVYLDVIDKTFLKNFIFTRSSWRNIYQAFVTKDNIDDIVSAKIFTNEDHLRMSADCDPDEFSGCWYVRDSNECWIKDEDNVLVPASSLIDDVGAVQSYRSITETFERLLETVPRLISTDRIIIPNGVVDQDK